MIKAIIFDLYDVLAVRDIDTFCLTYFPDDVPKNQQVKELQIRLGKAEIGYIDFIAGLAQIGGVSTDTVLRYTENYKPNAELLDYIGTHIKPHYKTGIVSNSSDDSIEEILEPSDLSLFNNIILSYQAGVVKPQPEIYRLSAKNLGVRTDECLFIDGVKSFCEGAERVGMQSLRYRNFAQTEREFAQLLTIADN